MDLAKRLKAYRKDNGLSLSDMAKEAELSKTVIWQIENEVTKHPRHETVMKLLIAMDIDEIPSEDEATEKLKRVKQLNQKITAILEGES